MQANARILRPSFVYPSSLTPFNSHSPPTYIPVKAHFYLPLSVFLAFRLSAFLSFSLSAFLSFSLPVFQSFRLSFFPASPGCLLKTTGPFPLSLNNPGISIVLLAQECGLAHVCWLLAPAYSL